MEVFAIYLLICDAVGALCTCAVDQEEQKIGFDGLDVGNGGVYGMCGLAIASKETEAFGITR
jgi:hypothetical protein